MKTQINPEQINDSLRDEVLIRQMVERWAVWRDAGDWERFATVWHTDGVMMATWFQGHFKDFIRVTQEGWAKGVSILHFLGGSAVDISADGSRAISQTKMTISQRGMVEGVDGQVLCDVVCTGRFYDFVVKENGEWKKYSTEEVKAAVNKLSAGLLQLGVSGHNMTIENQDKIALVSKNRPEWLLLDLACQQIGAALCPIYPTTNVNELEYVDGYIYSNQYLTKCICYA